MNSFSEDIIFCTKTLKSGGIILYPTDTIWGIGCDATNSAAVKRIYQLKKRAETKSMILLLSDKEMLTEYVGNPSKKILLYLQKQTKPTTAIFENAINLPAIIINNDGTVGMRITQDKFCKTVIEKLKRPLVSTSANISGESFPQNFLEISAKIKNGVDYIVQHRQNDFEKKAPSSIIKLNSDNEIEVIR